MKNGCGQPCPRKYQPNTKRTARTINTMAWTFEGLVFHHRIRSTSPHVLATHFKALLDCIATEQLHAEAEHSADEAIQAGIHETVDAFLHGYQASGVQAA